jgi:hypothetical protein
MRRGTAWRVSRQGVPRATGYKKKGKEKRKNKNKNNNKN